MTKRSLLADAFRAAPPDEFPEDRRGDAWEPPPEADGSAGGPRGLATTCLATIKPVPIHWLVPDYLPLGKLVLVAGDGGHGKSTLTLGLTAAVTRGRPAFGLNYKAPSPADVLLISCEDDYGDTVVPRLLAAGADLGRVRRVDGVEGEDGKLLPFNFAYYQSMEEELRKRPDVRLVIVDPAGSYISRAGVDDHRDGELRTLLEPMAELAARCRVVILLVKHLIKGATAKAVHKVGGSIGYVNSVRAAFVVAPDAEDEARKLFLPLKFNIAKKPAGLAYRLQPLPADEQAPILGAMGHLGPEDLDRLAEQLFRLEWLGPVDVAADDALGDPAKRGPKPRRTEEAAAWLRQFLTDRAYPSEEVFKAGEAAGFNRKNLYTAKEKLNVRASNKGWFGGVWHWGFGDPRDWIVRPEPVLSRDEGQENYRNNGKYANNGDPYSA